MGPMKVPGVSREAMGYLKGDLSLKITKTMDRRKDFERGKVRNIIPKWCCRACGWKHQAGSCDHYRANQADWFKRTRSIAKMKKKKANSFPSPGGQGEKLCQETFI